MPLWEDFLEFLDEQMGAQVIDRWVRSLKLVRFDARNLYLEAQDPLQVAWFEEHIRPLVKTHFLNPSQYPIRVHLQTPQSEKAPHSPTPPSSFQLTPDRVDPELTLEHFIQSSPNAVAFQLISEITQTSFNPIYLFGPRHSGKTHLLTAAAHLLQARGKKVFFVRADTFTSHVVQAIRQGSMQQLRETYRRIDALIIDDIDRFAKKAATQEEFFHTFNTLHLEQKPILLGSRYAPSQLTEIEPRLISRFDWGISVALEPTNALAVLQKKASLWKLPFSSELLKWLATSFQKDPLLALQALSLRAKGVPSLSPITAEPLLTDLLSRETEQKISFETILQITASHYGIVKEDILGKSHTRECVIPRQMAMFFCRHKLDLPYQAIGAMFHRDHSTVMASIRLVQKNLDDKKQDIVSAYQIIEAQLTTNKIK